jgi:hypothetical protein
MVAEVSFENGSCGSDNFRFVRHNARCRPDRRLRTARSFAQADWDRRLCWFVPAPCRRQAAPSRSMLPPRRQRQYRCGCCGARPGGWLYATGRKFDAVGQRQPLSADSLRPGERLRADHHRSDIARGARGASIGAGQNRAGARRAGARWKIQ